MKVVVKPNVKLPREPLADHPNKTIRDALLAKREPTSLISGQKSKFVSNDAYRLGWDRTFGAASIRWKRPLFEASLPV